MHTPLTITLFFPSNTEKLFCKEIFRSLLNQLQRKFQNVMTLSSRSWDSIQTIYTCLSRFLRNIADLKLLACSNQSLLVNCSRNFLCSRKTSGEVSFGQTASIWQPSASGEIGQWSNNMSLTREKQWEARDSFVYSPEAMPSGHTPSALPRGN